MSGRRYWVMSTRAAGSSGSATTSASSVVRGEISKSRGLGRGFTGAGTSANSAVTRRSISSTFTSPTTITAMRSGRYQCGRTGEARHASSCADSGLCRSAAGGVPAAVEHLQQRLPPHPFRGGLAAVQLRQHDAAFGLDVGIGERGVAGPLAQDGEPGLEYLAVARGNREDVDRLAVPVDTLRSPPSPRPPTADRR